MKHYISPPRLSTAFSESGRSAKRRLSNILDTRARRIGVAIITVIILTAILAGAVLSLRVRGQKNGSTPEGEVTMAERLFETKHAYVGDASANGRTASALGIAANLGGFTNELQTKTEPYGWKLTFESEPEGEFDKMSDYAVALLALIDNLGYIEWDYNNGVTLSLSADGASKRIGRDVKSAADTVEDLAKLLDELGIYNYRNEIYIALTRADLDDFMSSAVVIRSGETQSLGKLHEFLNICAMKIPGALNIVNYTEEGYPVLLRLVTDGESFWGGEYDGYVETNEPDTPKYYGFGPYKHLKISPFRDTDTAAFYLANDPELTYEEIFRFLLSSSYNPDPPEFRLLFHVENAGFDEEYMY
ncbi:MAG: DUF4825 domain-containing protein [Oscillospiraceae bacterium]|nr:DUF4825 domain-containing protein [Oscillospiraceae bacterium]